MKILVVGNGFDLAHGLPTSYKDCLNFLYAVKLLAKINSHSQLSANYDELCQTYSSVREKIPYPFQMLLEDIKNRERPENKLYSLLEQYTKDNFWLNHFISCQMDGSNYRQNWIDFEQEIAIVIQKVQEIIDLARKESTSVKSISLQPFSPQENEIDSYFKPVFEFCCKSMSFRQHMPTEEDILALIDNLYHELQIFTTCLEIYLALCQKHFPGAREKRLSAIDAIGPIDKVLSFNYTDTFRPYMRNPKNCTNDICFIHGHLRCSIEDENSPLILGIDEYLPENERDQRIDFVMFRKYFQRIFKSSDYQYVRWHDIARTDPIDFDDLQSIKGYDGFPVQLFIFGHSLDITDKDVLREIILKEDTKTTIFYRNNQQLKCQVKNLIRLIGSNELNQRTRSKERTIYFQHQ